jgi:hypothetical protein
MHGCAEELTELRCGIVKRQILAEAHIGAPIPLFFTHTIAPDEHCGRLQLLDALQERAGRRSESVRQMLIKRSCIELAGHSRRLQQRFDLRRKLQAAVGTVEV